MNHFIPLTEAEVNAPARFESDFMVQYLAVIASKAKQSISHKNEKLDCHATLAMTADNGLPRRFTPRNHRVQNESGLSIEPNAVLNAGCTLWQAYFAHPDVRNVCDAFKLNRPDVVATKSAMH